MKNGLSSWCIKCHLAAVQEWRERNRDKINAARREAYGSSQPPQLPQDTKATARHGSPSRELIYLECLEEVEKQQDDDD